MEDDDNKTIWEICSALGEDGYYEDGPLRYSFANNVGVLEVIQGMGHKAIYDGSWHISGDARQRIIKLLKRAHKVAAKVLEDEKQEAARKHEKDVERNNAHVLDVLADPKAALRIHNV
jgi:hypothetical protein